MPDRPLAKVGERLDFCRNEETEFIDFDSMVINVVRLSLDSEDNRLGESPIAPISAFLGSCFGSGRGKNDHAVDIRAQIIYEVAGICAGMAG